MWKPGGFNHTYTWYSAGTNKLDGSSSIVVRPRYLSPCAYTLYEAGALASQTLMSKQWTTSPRSSWVKDWHIQCVMQNSVLRPRCTGWWVVESAGKMLLRQIYEGLRESNMARTPCIYIFRGAYYWVTICEEPKIITATSADSLIYIHITRGA